MPSVSPRQARAMRAACYGKSRSGIPRKVGCEFVKADRKRVRPRRANPMKYRMIDPPSAGRASKRGLDLKTIGVLALIGVGIYFAWSKESAQGMSDGT